MRLLSWNTYLVPPPWIQRQHPTYFQPSYALPLRAKRIIEFANSKQADLICLQEVWGTQSAAFNKLLGTSHELYPPQQSASKWAPSNILPGCVYIRFSVPIQYCRWLSEPMNWVYSFYMARGGLMTAIRRRPSESPNSGTDVSIAQRCLWREQHAFTKSFTASKKGVTGTLLECTDLTANNNSETTERSYLLLLNTHLDAKDGFKADQLREIHGFLKGIVSSRLLPCLRRKSDGVYTFDGTLSSVGRRPMANESAPLMAIDNVGIVLCGDFNIKSDSAEYQSDLVSLGGRNRVLRDLYLHPAAVNDITSDRGGEQCTFDPVGNSMAVEHEAAGRIDYIFTVDELMLNIRSTKTPEASVSLRFLPVKASNLTIHAADIQASDHYPITVDIELF